MSNLNNLGGITIDNLYNKHYPHNSAKQRSSSHEQEDRFLNKINHEMKGLHAIYLANQPAIQKIIERKHQENSNHN